MHGFSRLLCEKEGERNAVSSFAVRSRSIKMVANSYTVGMGITLISCIVFPGIAYANQMKPSSLTSRYAVIPLI